MYRLKGQFIHNWWLIWHQDLQWTESGEWRTEMPAVLMSIRTSAMGPDYNTRQIETLYFGYRKRYLGGLLVKYARMIGHKSKHQMENGAHRASWSFHEGSLRMTSLPGFFTKGEKYVQGRRKSLFTWSIELYALQRTPAACLCWNPWGTGYRDSRLFSMCSLTRISKIHILSLCRSIYHY